MAIDVQRSLDFGNARKAINLPNPTAAQDAATKSYVDSAVEGLAWKDSCRVSTQGNINLLASGASIDGITLVANDRVLVKAQTNAAENGIYIWNGASVAMTRALDANIFDELEQAITTVEEGTNAGASYRQTAVNGTLGTTAVTWANFAAGAGAASSTSAGIARLATQVETDAGTDPSVIITPQMLANSVYAQRKATGTIGDGTATSFTINHNFNSRYVRVEVFRNSGNYDTVWTEVQRTSVNAVTIVVDTAPAVNALNYVISF